LNDTSLDRSALLDLLRPMPLADDLIEALAMRLYFRMATDLWESDSAQPPAWPSAPPVVQDSLRRAARECLGITTQAIRRNPTQRCAEIEQGLRSSSRLPLLRHAFGSVQGETLIARNADWYLSGAEGRADITEIRVGRCWIVIAEHVDGIIGIGHGVQGKHQAAEGVRLRALNHALRRVFETRRMQQVHAEAVQP